MLAPPSRPAPANSGPARRSLRTSPSVPRILLPRDFALRAPPVKDSVPPQAALWDRIAARLDDVPGPQTSRPLAWRELAQGVAQADLVCDASGAWMSGLLWLVRGAPIPAALDGRPFVSFPIDGQASAGLPADQETLLYIRR